MKLSFFKTIATVALLFGIAIPIGAEDLDAALAAQKKKAQRRVYSEYARIENRDLEVPRTKTEEEQNLDKKLRKMDEQAEMEARSEFMQSFQYKRSVASSVSARTAPEENRNWLTAAILEDKDSETLADTTEDNWLAQELDRQKTTQAVKKEKEIVAKLLSEQSRLQPDPANSEPFKNYQLVPQSFIGNQNPSTADSSSMISMPNSPDPITSFRQTSKREEAPALSRFSPQPVTQSSSLNYNPLQSTMGRLANSTPGASSDNTSPGFSSRLNPLQPAPLTPLQKIKNASPIYQSDPFTDDHMPKIKTSIWE